MTQELKTCNCVLNRNWPFPASYCQHGWLLTSVDDPTRGLKAPTRAYQVQTKGVVAKAPLEGLKGL